MRKKSEKEEWECIRMMMVCEKIMISACLEVVLWRLLVFKSMHISIYFILNVGSPCVTFTYVEWVLSVFTADKH